MNELPKYLYRYEINFDSLRLERYKVKRQTPCGYWIDDWHINKNNKVIEERWTAKNTFKAFARESKEKALKDFIARKLKYIEHLNIKLNDVNKWIKIAKRTDTSIKLLTFDGGF